MPRLTRFQGFLLVSAALIATVVVVSGVVVGRFFEAHVLSHEQEHTAEVVKSQARQHLTPAEFARQADGARAGVFQTFLEGLPGVFRVKVFDPSGRIVWSNESRLIGRAFPDNTYLARALRGEVATVLEAPERSEHVYEKTRTWVAEAYVPITFPERPGVVGVIETYKDMTDAVLGIRLRQRIVWSVAAGIGALLYVALAFVVWKASLAERRAIGRLEAQNRELTLLQQFTRSVLKPLDLNGLAASMVESAGAGLGLVRAGLYQVRPGRELALLAGWPTGEPTPTPPKDLTVEAIEMRREVIRGAAVALPMSTQRGTERLFLAEFKHPVSEADRPAVRTLEIMLNEAAIALANVELFTEIREAHERLAAILAGIADRMLIVDREMRVVWMNVAAAETQKVVRGVGLPCFEVFDAEPSACEGCPAIRTLQSGGVERGVRVQRLANGEARYLDLVTAPLRDASGRVHQVLEVARDITDLVEMEERLKQSAARLEDSHAEVLAKAEELERANRALREAQAQLVENERLAAVGDVVVGLHHAILNPLTGILGALQVLKQEGTVDPRRAQALGEAEAEIRRIEQIVRRLPSLRRAAGTRYVGGTTMLDLERSCDREEPA